MRIADLPRELRPRERLLAKGATALTDAELVAILLRTGIGGMSAIELGQSLIDRFGSLSRLLAATAPELETIRGLGVAKRAELLAITEVQRRVLTALLAEGPVLDSAQRVTMFLRHRFNALLNESFVGLFTDVQYRLIAVEDFGSGALQRVAIYPREIIRAALRHNAAAVVFAHNHPSGRAEPSDLDKTLTKKLQDAMRCIEVSLLDHLIVTPAEIWSFRANGLC
ncbi:MAG: JAB domain-containing protein [Oxalobacteraceae bacterium]|jgi:DNA repair protein RadC|nr:JAB domain-containing protein [Oxalobacteraceae bacterium]